MTKPPEELTKDWKEGKLDRGWYFVKTMHGFIQPMYYLITRACGELVKGFAEEPEDRVAEVLAHCNYTEYKAMQEQLNKEGTWYTEISYKKIKKENNQLRDLLRECKRHLYFQKKINNEVITLLTRINAALGESEE